MLNPVRPEENTAPPVVPNSTTKADLLSRAKAALDAGENSLREAAEALALAQQDFDATQREIAKAVGRSAGWVNRLLKWQRSGYQERSPFGPTTKADRVSHAKRRIKASRPREVGAESKVDDDPNASADRRKAENAKLDAEFETATSTAKSPLAEFKAAVDHWFHKMDDAARGEAVAYAIAQSGVQVSSKWTGRKAGGGEASPA